MSERHACRIVGQPRGTQRYSVIMRADEDALTRAIIDLAAQYGRYGYRRITALLSSAGWIVSTDRVQRIWRREGLSVPKKQRPRGRLWLNDGSCVRLRPEHRNHVWSYDFVEAQTHDGRKARLITLIDEFTRECLANRVARRINGMGVIEAMADAMIVHGVPEHIRSDNGPEMTAKIVRDRLAKVGAKTLYIEPGSPWEMAIVKASTQTSRRTAQWRDLLQPQGSKGCDLQWRKHYNTVRPHSSFGYRSPASQVSNPFATPLEQATSMQ